MFEVSCGVTKRFSNEEKKDKFVNDLDKLLGEGTHEINVKEIVPLFDSLGIKQSEMVKVIEKEKVV